MLVHIILEYGIIEVILLYSNKAKTILSKCALIMKIMYIIYLYSFIDNIKKTNLDRKRMPNQMLIAIGYTAK